MSKIIFVVFAFYRSLIIALILLNEFNLNNSYSRGDREEDKSFLFFKELMLNIERV